MQRRAFTHGMLAAVAALPGALVGQASHAATAARRPIPSHRSVSEYSLAQAEQTHEILQVPGTSTVLISQMGPSSLLKVAIGPTGRDVESVRAFPIGAADAGLHGLAQSRSHPGKVWCTLEGDDRVLLLDPVAARAAARPSVLKSIPMPRGVHGPHYVGEYDGELWITCKASEHVVRLDPRHPERAVVYPALPKPIFVARHPVSGEFYVSQDAASSIMRVNRATGRTQQIPVPESAGSTPVGLIAGPDRLWVALLGTAQSGTGTLGSIAADGQLHWHRLRSPLAADASLLHLTFDPPGRGTTHRMWLLGSSIVDDKALDMVIRVEFDEHWSSIRAEDSVVLPTQRCKAHRLLAMPNAVLATELATSTLAVLDRPATSSRNSDQDRS
ncbi:MAG: hypothetical protein ACRDQ5_06505 [Sciscionella sp.]